MKNKYQKTFSVIRPSDELVERIMDMTKKENKKKINLVPALAILACLAIFVTGLFAGGVFKNEPKVSNQPQLSTSITQGVNSSSKIAPGFVMVAYANDEQKDVQFVDNVTDLESSTPFICQIGAVDIKGKSQDEIDKILDDIYDEYSNVEGKNEYGKVHYVFSTNRDIYDDAVIYEAYCGNFNFDINDDTIENVKEIRVYNENKDYGCVEIQAVDVYYNDDLTQKNDGINYDKSVFIDNRFIGEKYAKLSGERYQKCYALGKIIGGVNKYFGINWKINDKLYELLNENPNYDLSSIKDSITFEVEFNDGSISKSVIDIAFTKDGRMYAVDGKYDFIN